MAIKNSVSNHFLYMFVDSIDVFDCPLPGVIIGHQSLLTEERAEKNLESWEKGKIWHLLYM